MIPNRFWAQAKGPLSTLYPYRSFIHLDTTVLSDVAHAWGSLCDLAGVGRSKAKQICQGWQDEPTWSTWIANHPHHIMQYFGVIPLSNSEKWRIHRDPGIQNNSKHGRCHHYWEGSPSKLCVSKPKRQGPMACVLNSHLAVGLTSFDSDLTCFFAVQHDWTNITSKRWNAKKQDPQHQGSFKGMQQSDNHQQSGSSRWFLPKPSRCWLQNWSLRVCCWLGRLLRPVPMMWQSFCRCHGVMEVRAWPLVWRLLVLYDTIDVRNLTPSCGILL